LEEEGTFTPMLSYLNCFKKIKDKENILKEFRGKKSLPTKKQR
jgi:hypothetical protein